MRTSPPSQAVRHIPKGKKNKKYFARFLKNGFRARARDEERQTIKLYLY